MRIINVITIKEGIVDEITSFGIFEEQLSDEQVKHAEDLFISILEEYGVEDAHFSGYIDDGYFQGGNFGVCLTWSDI